MEKKYNLKIRAKEIDYDYIHKLNDEEKAWLNKFTEEYVNASLPKDEENLHNTPELKKACFDKNNAKNRCIMSMHEAKYTLQSLEDVNEVDDEEAELNEMIEYVDDKLSNSDS